MWGVTRSCSASNSTTYFWIETEKQNGRLQWQETELHHNLAPQVEVLINFNSNMIFSNIQIYLNLQLFHNTAHKLCIKPAFLFPTGGKTGLGFIESSRVHATLLLGHCMIPSSQLNQNINDDLHNQIHLLAQALKLYVTVMTLFMQDTFECLSLELFN